MIHSTLKPERVFYYFEQISQIPRGSGNEQAVAEYVEGFAKERNLFVIRDKNNNVFIRKPASAGREGSKTVVLQGHLDMVCEANSSTVHDFTKDPIKLKLNGDILSADGTTLGADDGVAVAIMLALLESDSISLPQLECLFTTEEETGLAGMKGFDASVVEGRLMINLDSAGEGEATVSCAGGVRTHLDFPAERETIPDGYTAIKLTISGLAGGHSGEDINLGRTSANNAAARIMYAVSKETDAKLISIDGGSKDNAIARECAIIFCTSSPEKASDIIKSELDNMKLSLADEDSKINAEITPVKVKAETGYIKNSEKLINLLNIIPTGVRTMSSSIPGLVETSSNMGVIKTADSVSITVSCRSSVSTELDYMQNILECAASLSGCTVEHTARYPGWEFTHGSELQDIYLEAYRTLYGKEAKIIGIHAGLECGIFKQKVPDMDIISIGPNIKDLHSPDETLSVSSLERLYDLLLEILKRV